MVKGIIIGLIIGIIAGFTAAGLFAWGDSAKKIAKVEKDAAEYKAKYDSTRAKADSLDRAADRLLAQRQGFVQKIDSLRGEISVLENQRQSEIRRVAEIDQPHELIAELQTAFPAFRNKPMGTIEMENPRTGKYVTSFYLPVMFITSFIEDRKDVESFVRQKEAWETIGLTYESYVAMQDSVITLKEKKAQAYEDGMKYGMEKYDTLVQDYISTLKNPPKVEFPKMGSIAVGTAIGLAAGVAAGAAITK